MGMRLHLEDAPCRFQLQIAGACVRCPAVFVGCAESRGHGRRQQKTMCIQGTGAGQKCFFFVLGSRCKGERKIGAMPT